MKKTMVGQKGGYDHIEENTQEKICDRQEMVRQATLTSTVNSTDQPPGQIYNLR